MRYLKFGGGILAGVVAWGLIVLLIFGASFAVRWVIAEPAGQLEARERIQSGDFRIAAYDRFYDLCASVQADEDRVDNLQAELDDEATTDDRAAQVRASITAVKSSRSEKIRRYNTDAQKDYTRGQFRDSDLPYRIDPSGEDTRCEL